MADKSCRHGVAHPVALVLVVIAVRAIYVLVLHQAFDITVGGDYYDEIARNLVAGHGYVIVPGEAMTLFRYPGYTYFLAMLFMLSDESYLLVVVTQLLLDIASLGLIYLVAQEIFGRNTAILTLVLATLYPFSAIYVLRYTTEPLFTFLLAGAMLGVTRGFLRGGGTHFIVAGGLFGAAILCRASLFYFLFLVPVLVPFLGDARQRWVRFGGAMTTVVVAIAVLVPWGMRNMEITGEFNLLGTAGGYSLWVGNNLTFDGLDRDELPPEQEVDFLAREQEIADGAGLFSVEGERRFTRMALQGWIDQPLASAWLIVRKAFRFWFSIYQPQNRRYALVLVMLQAALLGFALFGMIRGLREGRPQWLLVALVVYLNAIHAVVVSTFRYSLPIMPYVIVFASHGSLVLPWVKQVIGRRCAPPSELAR